MIPLALDPSRIRVAVAGRGEAAARRARLLALGAPLVKLFTDTAVVGTLPENVVLLNALPDAAALSQVEALWIAGLARAEAAAFATLAREQRVLLNVEDVPALCDFHSVAEVRRGDLLIGISTGGKSPGLAARVRRWIEGAFGPEWAERTAEIARQRDEWRARGASIPELACLTDETIATAGWMP